MTTWAKRFERRQYLKGSLWVLPVLGGILGVVLAQGALWLDAQVTLPAHWHYSAGTASGVLTAIVGATVALLGFVVTIGVLVVQQATNSLSPRYMRLWYRDRLQKAVLASFAGTLTFSFSLLRRVENNFVPDIGIAVAGAAVAVALALLLVYLDRFTHSLRPAAVAAIVGDAGRQTVEEWARLGAAVYSGEESVLPLITVAAGPVFTVRANRPGAIQAVHLAGLVHAAQRYDCTIVVVHAVGDFVDSDTPLVMVHGRKHPPEAELRGLFALGRERTIEQDPAFALRILVDVAIKALSPAINDPTTAVQVLDRIEVFLQTVARVPLWTRYNVPGPDGVSRLVVPGRTWEEFLSLAVTEIRRYGATSTQVCRRLRAMLEALAADVSPDRLPAIRDELRRLDETVARAFPDAEDRALAGGSDRQGIGGRAADLTVSRDRQRPA